MIFNLLILLVLSTKPFAFIPGASHPTPPNQSNTTPPFSVRDAQLLGPSTLLNQSNETPSPAHPAQLEQQSNLLPPAGQSNSTPPFPVRVPPSPDHEIQPEQQLNPIPLSPSWYPNHSPPPGQSNSTPTFPVTVPLSPDHEIQPEQQCNSSPLSRSPTHPYPLSQSNTIPLISVLYQRTTRASLPSRIPWHLQFVQRERRPHGPLPHEFHRMDNLNLCVPGYFFASGLSHTSSWSQRPNLSTSIYIQCFLNQVAFSLFVLANAVFPRKYPLLAFYIDRFSFLLVIISAYLASMPMYPPYVAIIMFLIVIIVYIFVRYRG